MRTGYVLGLMAAIGVVSISNGASTASLLAHRWSFNGDYTDSVGGLTAVPTGSPTFSSDGKLVLPGGNKGTANVDLGENALSVDSNNVTIEIWAQQDKALQYARLFEYYPGTGSDKNNDMYMAWNTANNNVNTDKLEVKSNGVILFARENSLQPYTLGTMYHIAMTFRSNADGSTTVNWAKRSTATGAIEKSGTQTVTGWTLATFHQSAGSPHLRLGCSLWGEADPCAHYDEVRVWRGELSPAQLSFNAFVGPDRLPFEVETFVDGVPEGQLAHRWSFNGDYSDSVGGMTARPTGSPYFSTADQLVLPGGNKGTANVELGERALAYDSNSATIEIWAQQNQALQYARLFEYYSGTGSDKNNDMYMAWNTKGNNVNTDKLEVKSNGTVLFAKEDTLQPYTLGTMYHISMAFKANDDGSTTVSWAKRNSESGAIEKSGSQNIANWTLGTFHQFAGSPTLRLGCSLWGEADPCANYDEVRIWNVALNEEQLTRNAMLGANTLPAFYSQCAVAHWTGVGVAGKLDDPANWACTNTTGQVMPGALPGLATKVVFSGVIDVDIPFTTPLCCSEVEFNNASLAADRDWRGVPACVKIGGSLNLAGHKFFISTLAGAGAIDDVSTDFEHPGELHVETAAGVQADGTVRMIGNLKFIKDGAGTLIMRKTGQTYSSGTIVAGGTLKLGASMSNGTLGPDNTDVRVEAGAALDGNGTENNDNHTIVLNGGTLMNSVYDVYAWSKKYYFGNVRLEADSYANFQSGGLVGRNYAAVTLDLNGHTLYWWGKNDRSYLWNVSFTPGTIEVAADAFFTIPNYGPINASGVTFVMKGQFLCEHQFHMGDYICETTGSPYWESYMTENSRVDVSGTFRPKTDYFWGCVLLNGATLDLSDRTEAWTPVSAIPAERVAHNVAFADNAVIKVELGTRHLDATNAVQIVSWDEGTRPSNLSTLSFKVDRAHAEKNYTLAKTNDGLFLIRQNMMIIIR